MQAFASAVATGALGQLTCIDLTEDNISDPGLSSLSETLTTGALPSLQTLYIDYGPLGTEHPQLKAVCEERGIELT